MYFTILRAIFMIIDSLYNAGDITTSLLTKGYRHKHGR